MSFQRFLHVKNKKQCWIVFSLLFIVFALACYIPFVLEGKSVLRTVDGLDQHYAFFVYEGEWVRGIVRNFLSTGKLTIPMWDTSMGYGADILTTSGPSFGDPFYLLSVFLPKKYAEYGYNFIVFLRIYLAGVAMLAYVLEHRFSYFGSLVGALLYSFSGWMLLSSSQSGLVNAAIFLPLLLLGLDRILDDKSPILLIVATALLFIYYFYFGYMMCFFLPAYAALRVLSPNDGLRIRERSKEYYFTMFKKVLWAAFLYVVGICIAGFMLLPVVSSMFGQGRLGLERYSPLLYEARYYPMILAGFINAANIGPDSMMGCGALCLPCIVLLMRRRGNRVLKISFIALTAVLLVPFAGRVLNGMGYVTNRWAFAYAFCVSVIAARMLDELPDCSAKERRSIIAVVMVYAGVIMVFPNVRDVGSFACLALLSVMLLHIFNLDSTTSQNINKGSILAFALLSVSVPAFFYYSGQIDHEVDYGTAWKEYAKSDTNVSMNAVEDDTLYRYDASSVSHVRNSDMVLDHNGYDFYMSIYNSNIERFENGLRLAKTSLPQQISGPCGSAYLNAAFGTKYYVQPVGMEQSLPYGYKKEPAYTAKKKDKELGVYRSDIALPFAYAIDQSISTSDYEALTPIEKRQSLLQSVALDDVTSPDLKSDAAYCDLEPQMTFTNPTKGLVLDQHRAVVPEAGGTITVSFQGTPRSELYLEVENMTIVGTPPTAPKKKTFPKLVDYLIATYMWSDTMYYGVSAQTADGAYGRFDGQTYKSHMYGGKNSSMIYLGYSDEPVNEITLTFETVGTYTFDSIRVVEQPVDQLDDLVQKIRQQTVDVREETNSYVAQANFDHDGYLYFTVPWSEGWSAKVDGKDAEALKANQAFIAVRLPKGEHNVVLTYCTPHLKEGMILSTVGLVVAIAAVMKQRLGKPSSGKRIIDT